MHTLIRDFRYSLRVLLRMPGFTATAVICLALGIGATTAIFSVVQAVVMRPLPYRDSGRLARLYSEFPLFPGGGLKKFWISGPEFLDLRREMRSWESLEGWVNGGVNLGANEPLRVTASFVTGGMLRMLGVNPLRGRLHTDEDDRRGAPLAAVISEGLWQRGFGRDPKTIGRTAKLNGQDCTIVGVMPASFEFPPGEPDPPQIWVPVQLDPNGGRSSHFLSVIGRLKAGVTFEQSGQEIAAVAERMGRLAVPGKFHTIHAKNHPLVHFRFHDEVVGSVRPAMLMMLAAVGFVLLISCVNVANLLLARSESRQREIAVRRAVGAGTRALARQFIVEGIVLSGLGAAAGLALAWGGLRLILAVSPTSIPRVAEIGMDATVLLFAIGVSLVTGLFFGLAPLAQVTAKALNEALKGAAGRTTASIGATKMRSALVAVELALALVLLIGAGLMMRAFWKLQTVDIGLRAEGLLTMRVALPQQVYKDDAVRQFWTRLQERVAAIPGVASSTMMTGLPPQRQVNANDTQFEGFVPKPGGPVQNVDYYQGVGRRYFETMGIRLIEGRFFDDRDAEGAPASVIVNQTLARTFWPGQSALGRRVRPNFSDPWRTVVGVVEDVKNAGIDQPAGTELYFPYRQAQGGLRGVNVVLRTGRDPMSLAAAVRSEIAALDPTLPVANVRTMEDVVFTARSRPRFLTLLLTMFAAVALALAAVGIYGVVSYSVARRTSEFGVRMAMGARPRDVLTLVLGHGLKLGAAGVALGAAGAFGLTRFIRRLLFGIDPLDPVTFVLMAALLAAIAVGACLVPARRATKVDPLTALRYE